MICMMSLLTTACDDDEDDDNDTHKSSRNMVVASRQNTETTFLKKTIGANKKILTRKCLPFCCCFKGVIATFSSIIKFRNVTHSDWLKKLAL